MSRHGTPIPMISRPCGPLRGTADVPGDKSISHRALILGALTVGETRITGLLEGQDVLDTAAAMRAFGATVTDHGGGNWSVEGVGVGGFAEPDQVIDCGNSGTGVRLIMGAMATSPITATFTGDASLNGRPMARVTDPLALFGTQAVGRAGGRLPMTIVGARDPIPADYTVPVPSAQVKSAVLLAGLNAPGKTVVREAEATRDHTERMLAGFGAQIEVDVTEAGRVITLTGQPELTPQAIEVPRDPSSAAFPVCAALIVPGSDVLVPGIGLNPTRAGLFTTLREMGADLAYENEREEGGEPVADLRARFSPDLKGIEVPSHRAASMIDEYPVLSVVAAFAVGKTHMPGVKELRVKESDRIAAMAAGLRANGISVEDGPDWWTVTGLGHGKVPGGATTASHLDHRIAMSFLILGMAAREPVSVDDGGPIATSFPIFEPLMRGLGAHLERSDRCAMAQGFTIAIDGPAAAGKGTIARAVAAHFGFAHLDTGLLYRAVGAKTLLGLDAEAAARALTPADLDAGDLRGAEVAQAASRAAARPEVRAALLDFQRAFARRAGGAVLDGRDIGTVICPDARAKLFVTATPEVRAQRRQAELEARGEPMALAAVLADVKERDARDESRAAAPLKPAPDALVLDTSRMDIESATQAAIDFIDSRGRGPV